MSSPCLSGGGGRTYGFELEIVKSPSTSTRTSHTSSPSSTISESSNSPLAISTRKPRTPRKRPNQTYNEAAALLSTAYPNIFSNQFTNPRKFTKPHQDTLLLDESSPELLWPFRVFDDHSGFLLHQPIENEKPNFLNEAKVLNSVSSCDKLDSHGSSMEFCDGYEEDFDAESILDEEIEEGIDSIMGNLSVTKEKAYEGSNKDGNSWYGNPAGYHFGGRFQLGFGNGMGKGVRAFRNGDGGNWWSFPIVDMLQISPRLNNNNNHNKNSDSNFNSNSKTKPKPKPKQKANSGEKKKKKVEKPVVESKNLELDIDENSIPQSNSSLLLKLNYDNVLNAWSDRGSPFSDEISGAEGGNDVSVGAD
ncbi:protein CHLOROPLAST IMPORT APPARATUS 2 isoform X2 [Jatropha curcas]|uniref:protein CHLOROPLAST IMPORT APPARATUS 2 isoform X2 n=1 Tax=Jatropha curcas TaxID=180498 RepID=UPI001893BAF2|nr:protein CHLOROPLAST IMPORT APPARATUS 2 isoform X2 [Jatropha curcas]